MSSSGIVAVHCGAGYHGPNHRVEYNKLSKRAAMKGVQVLKNGGTALEAVRDAIIVLENHPRTNCGYGSNLTLQGYIENDASLMNGRNLLYGGCGAVKGLRHPIKLAYDLCVKQEIKSSIGIIPPSLLVGNGAVMYSKSIGLKIHKNKTLMNQRTKEQYERYKKIYDYHAKINGENDVLLDTVGAVCMDNNGDVAAACSSGGILLKRSGRVGQGALYASGTWADSFDKVNETSVAVCTSGCGEHLVQTQLAREIARDLKHVDCPTTTLHKTISDKFVNSRFLRNIDQKLCGALVLHRNKNEVSLIWGHSTETMSIGYMRTDNGKPTALISELPHSRVGCTVNVGGSYYYINTQEPD